MQPFSISRYSKLVYIIMFRISRYALAHSFAQKHRFHRSRSPLRPLQPMFLNEILHHHINYFEHLLIEKAAQIKPSVQPFSISRYSKLVYIIMFRISRYALAHSFAQKHRLHQSRSPLRSSSTYVSERNTAPLISTNF